MQERVQDMYVVEEDSHTSVKLGLVWHNAVGKEDASQAAQGVLFCGSIKYSSPPPWGHWLAFRNRAPRMYCQPGIFGISVLTQPIYGCFANKGLSGDIFFKR